VDRFVAELAQVRAALGLERLHLFGSSWGGMLAMQYVLDRQCTPGHLADMHRRIAGSQLVVIEDASHLCFAEKPSEFNQVINSFLDRTDLGTAP
jgi:pimeloyl-ACP methyl ester carboxylesterase